MSEKQGMSRRGLLRGAGVAAGAAGLPGLKVAAGENRRARVTVGEDGVIRCETRTLEARIEKGFLTSLRSKSSGEEYIGEFDRTRCDALQLIHRGREVTDVGEKGFGEITTRRLNDQRAEVVYRNWNGDGVVVVSVDPESGDLLIEPSAFSSRPGVRSCRWLMKGLKPGLKLVAPFFQGASMSLDDPLIQNRSWDWPRSWEAGLAMLQSRSGGCWVHVQDSQYRYKCLQVGLEDDPYLLGLDTEAHGPIDDNLAAGGLLWRINVYDGDWKVPAARYRDWLWQAYGLSRLEREREEWIHGLRMAVSWCPGEIDILEALAERVEPGTVLLHFPRWRTEAYDENYPTYNASAEGKQFVGRAHELGFRVMPHFNSLETDPNNPVYTAFRDFGYRHIETKKLQGWSWVNRQAIGVPESNQMRLRYRDKKVMVKIHPGLSSWRSMLCNRIGEAARQLSLREVFVDVTLNTHNLHNSLVENMSSTEGMNRLLRQVCEIEDGLAVGGEGLNEIICQGQSFAQVHLFRSWQSSIEGLERAGGCAMNDYLFGKLTRSFGYGRLGGNNADEELRMRIHDEHDALPTITIRSAQEIVNPNRAVKRVLERARG